MGFPDWSKITEEALKPLPLTVMNASGPPAGTASGVIDWITGPDCPRAITEKTKRYKRIAMPMITMEPESFLRAPAFLHHKQNL